MRKQSAFNLFFGEHFSSLADTFKGKKFHDLPDPRFPFEPLKLIEGLFCHGHYFDPGIKHSQATNLYDHWQTMQPEEKREIIEVITDKIIVGKDGITINLSYAPSCKDMANHSCPVKVFMTTISA
jgi:hypothetical protein